MIARSIAGERFDVAVIGAGPAGATVARELARRGVATLLLDRARFPRAKVCGCCLNAAALAVLSECGLGDLTERLGAVPLERLELRAGRVARLPARGVAVSRLALDAALAEAAVHAGARFLDGASASVTTGLPLHRLRVTRDEGSEDLEVRVVVAAAGLGGRFLADERQAPVRVEPGSRLGGGAVLPCPEWIEPGVVTMATAAGGYVGMVQLEDESLDVAAAFDPPFVREAGGLGAAAAAVLAAAGARVPPGLANASWRGTPPLTTSRERLALPRLFVVGDAAGYLEPFTGQGMAWALAGARLLAPLVERAVRGEEGCEQAWERSYRSLIGRDQGICRAVAATVRRPGLTALAVRLLAAVPALARPLLDSVNTPAAAGA